MLFHSKRQTLASLFLAVLFAAPASATPPLATGYNAKGQLGDGTLAVRIVPVRAGSANTFVALAGGDSHSLGLTAGGVLWAWGGNASGQVGDGTTTNRSLPVQVSTAGVLAGRTITRVAANGRSSFAVLDNGTLAAWGHNLDGELGDGTTVNRPLPVLVPGLSTVTRAGVGGYHALTVLGDGSLRSWGYNGQGQLGDGSTTLRLSPASVLGITTATAVAAGTYHSLALLSDGTVRAWGFNGAGQLGDSTSTQRKSPVAVAALTGITHIAAGAEHSVALKDDGTVWAWGGNSQGELGLGDTTNRTSPVAVPGISNAVQVSAIGSHTLVRLADGSVRAFGDNAFGQLGDGSTTDRPSPVPVPNVTGATGIASGGFHSFILAPKKPVAVIAAVTGLKSTGATLNASVNPSDEPTTARFDYGLTPALGMTAPLILTPDNGSVAQSVNATLTGLTPGTVYHFQLSATNTAGTVISSPQTFTTLTRYAQWALDKLGSATASGTDDPDKDGLANIIEYGTGTEPLQNTTAPAVSVTNNRLTLTFTRNADASDANLIVQASDNLVTWTNIASSTAGNATVALVASVVVEEAGMGPVRTVAVRDLRDVNDPAHPRRFLRLRVTR